MKPKTRERKRTSSNSDDGSPLFEDFEVDEFSTQNEISSYCDEESSRLLNRDISIDDYSCLLEKESPKDDSLPKSIIFIVGNEFCERFSYYGLKTVLALYMTSELFLTEDSATSLYHGWSFSCYFTTIFGAILADSFLGRYRTILYLSIVYLAGNSVLSLAATKPIVSDLVGKTIISVIGLLLIAFGTGGIKPCVSAFGGDQFNLPEQQHQLSKFFAVFYFSINAGSLLSCIVTPILREDVTCFGGNCFPLAFGIPAILMLVALVLFLIGTPLYKIKASDGNVLANVVKCITFAIVRKLSSKFSVSKRKEMRKTPSHWLDLAEGKVPSSLINDVKILLNVLVLFLPLPFFWALFEQQGSRWTFQATKMSGEFGPWTIKPDQMQVCNPLLILILIPMFEYLVYPRLDRWRILTKPLQRMFVGGLFASFAFVISGFLQFKIESSSPSNSGSQLTLGIINALPCRAKVNLTSIKESRTLSPHEVLSETIDSIESFQLATTLENHASNSSAGNQITKKCPTISKKSSNTKYINTWKKQEIVLVINSYLGNLEVVDISKASFSSIMKVPRVRLIDTSDFLRLSYIELRYKNDTIKVSSNFFSKGVSAAEVINLKHGRYEVFLPNISLGEQEESLGYFSIDDDLSSLVILIYNLPQTRKVIRKIKVTELKPSSIHMMWLLPQYLAISVGEVMFSITGLQFSFTQAPPSMKCVVQASWLMTVAFGNLIVVIIAESKLIKIQSLEFFFFAGLMFLDMLVFLFLVRRFDREAFLERNTEGIKSLEECNEELSLDNNARSIPNNVSDLKNR